jgi:hypothetical protein
MSFVQAKPVATYDIYAQIHKGLRLALGGLLVRLGACGGDDPAETARLMADLRAQLALSEDHLAKEDVYVHTAFEARAPGAARALDADHAHHRRAFGEIAGLIGEVEAAPEPAAALKRLYLRWSLFVAEDFAHMAMEEEQILPVLQSLFSDEELIGIEVAIVSSLTPEQKMATGRVMVPAATRAERVALISKIRIGVPPQAFEPLLAATSQATLSPADYAALRTSLGLHMTHP